MSEIDVHPMPQGTPPVREMAERINPGRITATPDPDVLADLRRAAAATLEGLPDA